LNTRLSLFVLTEITAVGMTAFFIYYLSPIARQISLVDTPAGRKQHGFQAPLIGGLSIAIALAVALPLAPFGLSQYRYLFFGMGILVIAGVVDDHRDIGPKIKLLAQLIAAVVIVFVGGAEVDSIGDIFGWGDGNTQGLGPLAPLLTVMAVIGVINAINMIDGHDGLAAIVVILCLAPLCLLCWQSGATNYAFFLAVVISVVGVFLFFNLSFLVGTERQVFLGDAGSMMLGLFLAFVLVDLSSGDAPILKTASAPWLIGLPLLDLFSVILLRLRTRVSPLRADRRHIHHFLLDLGFGKNSTLLLLVSLQVVFSGFGISGTLADLPDALLFWPLFIIFFLYLFIYRTLNHQRKSAARKVRKEY